jgi:predicted permease
MIADGVEAGGSDGLPAVFAAFAPRPENEHSEARSIRRIKELHLAGGMQTLGSENAMRTSLQDLRYGLRLLRHSPGFAAVAIVTLALGIAVNATVFSWINELLLNPYPGSTDSSRLAVLEAVQPDAPNGANQISYVDYLDYRRDVHSLSGLALHREEVFSLGDAAHSQAIWGELVSGNYFSVLGVKPALGRTFSREEDSNRPGAFPVAVISDWLWRSRFQSDPAVIGKKLRVNRRDLTIVGVAPPEFRGTMPGLIFGIWIPVTMTPDLGLCDSGVLTQRGDHRFYAVARLAPGVKLTQAAAETMGYSRNLARWFPKSNEGVNATVRPTWEFHSGAPELLLQPLRILMVVSVLVLLIVCANVTNLLLARSVSRRRELSIRAALGAGSTRLSRQLLSETMLLAGAGAVAGLLLAPWMAILLPSLVPKIGVNVALGFHLSGRVLAFTVVTCVVAALLSGVAPVIFWLRTDINRTLNEGGRSGGQGARSHRLRGLLVISEVALATVALVGAGLFVRSFRNAASMNPGFDRNNLLMARFHLAGTSFSDKDRADFSVRLQERLRANPAISSVSYADYAPLGSSSGPYRTVAVEGYQPSPRESMDINDYQIAPGYFSTFRIPLVEGRDFRMDDNRNSQAVIIVNQTFARRYFHGGSALGRKVRYGRVWTRVVGVARDSKYFSVAEAPRPHVFAPYRQFAGGDTELYVFIRTAGDPASVIAGMRRDVAAVDPNAAAFDLMPITEWMGVTLLSQKVAASLLAALGIIALILAAIGLYSVMAYAVSQRTQEIGIRMALGARPSNVLADILSRGMTLTALGLAIGLGAAVAVTRLVSSLLVEVSALDPATFVTAAMFLSAIALVASLVPALRATKVDPMVALRCD